MIRQRTHAWLWSDLPRRKRTAPPRRRARAAARPLAGRGRSGHRTGTEGVHCASPTAASLEDGGYNVKSRLTVPARQGDGQGTGRCLPWGRIQRSPRQGRLGEQRWLTAPRHGSCSVPRPPYRPGAAADVLRPCAGAARAPSGAAIAPHRHLWIAGGGKWRPAQKPCTRRRGQDGAAWKVSARRTYRAHLPVISMRTPCPTAAAQEPDGDTSETGQPPLGRAPGHGDTPRRSSSTPRRIIRAGVETRCFTQALRAAACRESTSTCTAERLGLRHASPTRVARGDARRGCAAQGGRRRRGRPQSGAGRPRARVHPEVDRSHRAATAGDLGVMSARRASRPRAPRAPSLGDARVTRGCANEGKMLPRQLVVDDSATAIGGGGNPSRTRGIGDIEHSRSRGDENVCHARLRGAGRRNSTDRRGCGRHQRAPSLQAMIVGRRARRCWRVRKGAPAGGARARIRDHLFPEGAPRRWCPRTPSVSARTTAAVGAARTSPARRQPADR